MDFFLVICYRECGCVFLRRFKALHIFCTSRNISHGSKVNLDVLVGGDKGTRTKKYRYKKYGNKGTGKKGTG